MSLLATVILWVAGIFVVPADILAATLIPMDCSRKRRVRKAVHLADRRIAILSGRRSAALERALTSCLRTPAGEVLAVDPRIVDRVELFAALTRARNFDRELQLRRKAEANLLLTPMYESA